MNPGRLGERGLGALFCAGWLVLCAVAFGWPFLRTQMELARTLGSQGIVGWYYLRAGAGPDILRIDENLIADPGMAAMTGSRRFGARWRGELRIDSRGPYRFFARTRKGGVTVEVGRHRMKGRYDADAMVTVLESDPVWLDAGWHRFVVSWRAQNDRDLEFRMAPEGQAPAAVPPDRLRFLPEDAARVQSFQRDKGGVMALARLIFRVRQ